MLADFVLTQQSLDLEPQETKRKQALFKIEQQLKIASSASLSSQHSASAKAEEARNCEEELEDAAKRLGVASVIANRARDNAKTAKEESSKF